MLRASSSMSLLKSCSFTVMCSLHHWSFINTDSPPLSSYCSPSHCPLASSQIPVDSVSRINRVSQVSVSIIMLHCRSSASCQISASRSSILLERDLRFPIVMEGRGGLYRLLLERRCCPQPDTHDIGSVWQQCGSRTQSQQLLICANRGTMCRVSKHGRRK